MQNSEVIERAVIIEKDEKCDCPACKLLDKVIELANDEITNNGDMFKKAKLCFADMQHDIEAVVESKKDAQKELARNRLIFRNSVNEILGATFFEFLANERLDKFKNK